ncbi:MAG TPA: hypothetical protein VMT66_02860 [Steroidobacteraceae bacterium]|nr:hypothetical protein [Steroidobacteraceae bacterium]
MYATIARVALAGQLTVAGQLMPRSAPRGRGERLANWLGLLALLALGIVWQ